MQLKLKEEYSPLEASLVQAIYDSYHNHLIENAVFLAERLLAEKNNQETRIILAECYLANGMAFKLVYLLKDCTHPTAKYLLTMGLFKTGNLDEAEKVIRSSVNNIKATGLLGNSPSVANGSYGMYLLGQIAEKKGQTSQAIVYYEEAWKTNSSLWVALEKISQLRNKGEGILNFIGKQDKMEEEKKEEPRSKIGSLISQEPGKLSKSRTANLRSSIDKQSLMKNYASKKREKKRSVMQQEARSYQTLEDLIYALIIPYDNLINFNIKEALDNFKHLSLKQRNTAWVQTKLGNCHFFTGFYKEAAEKYGQAIQLDPTMIDGIEYYSSCLWHLNLTEELGNLAFKAFDRNPFSPEAWVALGNCYSKQNDHETALKFFHRSIELDRSFSYAYTLRGHEFVHCEKYNEASQCYLDATKVNKKSFFANWGLGNIYMRQERYEKALNHFTIADNINSCHSIIKSSIGSTYFSLNKQYKALGYFEQAENLNPKCLFIKFNKAKTLMRMGELDRALLILEYVKERSPKEFNIYKTMGEIFKLKGDHTRALECYHCALDIDPKESQTIKGLIEALTNENDYGDDIGMSYC